MIVVALDPGYATLAVAALDLRARLADSWILTARTISTSSDEEVIERQRAIRTQIRAVVALHRPDVFVYEAQTFAAMGAAKRGIGGLAAQWKSSALVEQTVGIAKEIAFDVGAAIVEVNPKTAKIAVLGPGAGNADKKRVKAMVLRLRWAGGAPKPHRISTHATDTVAIGIAGGRKLFAAQWAALDRNARRVAEAAFGELPAEALDVG